MHILHILYIHILCIYYIFTNDFSAPTSLVLKVLYLYSFPFLSYVRKRTGGPFRLPPPAGRGLSYQAALSTAKEALKGFLDCLWPLLEPLRPKALMSYGEGTGLCVTSLCAPLGSDFSLNLIWLRVNNKKHDDPQSQKLHTWVVPYRSMSDPNLGSGHHHSASIC